MECSSTVVIAVGTFASLLLIVINTGECPSATASTPADLSHYIFLASPHLPCPNQLFILRTSSYIAEAEN